MGSQLSSQLFLSKLITQYANIHQRSVGAKAEEYIRQLGIRKGEWIEGFFLNHYHTLTVDEYAELIIDIKNAIGGHFEIESVHPDCVVVKAHQCPFGDVVKDAPHLCMMTSSVFGGIASRHFGYGKVTIKERIANGDDGCKVHIYFSPNELDGEEYIDLPVTPEQGDPFAWEEETIKMLGEELRKSDDMVSELLTEIEELKKQVNNQQ
ncbi:Fis family transcriptional regulator [Pontibacillus yanchengensis]|uniref:Fis family transcriptional regulator n=2 Tax=Pontibacillus yanchengensis TaxID=462910 RepID=A0ACC7VC42_9BACI|nr:methanogen output domain 1-containing protein [Pontibacillus yanchengensis]MYL35318.1 Fis family transcriptional regulator [Pontibacillus yanchengensis]MYL52347.1 Fis family transcriptional regulator [Pontibacillus yanchengensis]